jgi:hypothetical protein
MKQMNKITLKKRPARDLVKTMAARATAMEFQRSMEWVYKVIRGELDGEYAEAGLKFYRAKYKELNEALSHKAYK